MSRISHFIHIFTCLVNFGFSAVTVPIYGQLTVPRDSRITYDSNPAADIEITLNGHQYSTRTRVDGTFRFHNVPTGIYLMDVHSVHDMFSQLKIKVNAETGVIRVAEYKYPGGKRLTPLPQHPIELTAIAPILYYEQTPPFSIVGMILGNPMMLMVVFSVAVVFGFPMLLSNLSEEELKEMQSSQVDPMQGFKSMLGVKEKEEEE